MDGRLGDYDNDGYLDLSVTGGSLDPETVAKLLYHNDGDGTFTEVGQASGMAQSGDLDNVRAAAWADYDNDGDLDLLVVNVRPDFESPPSRLYRNNGNGTFTDTWPSIGGSDHGLGAAWGDYDGDGDQDLYVASEFENDGSTVPQPSRLYRNNGNGDFTEVGATAGVGSSGLSRGVAWGDFDNDLDLDLYVVNNGGPNRLYRNDGDGTFTDVAEDAVVDDPKTGFGNTATWVDSDQDGDLDLYVSNLASSSPSRLFQNSGDGPFVEIGASAGVAQHSGGASWGDFDHDGDLDLYLPTVQFSDGGPIGWPNALYRNEGTNNNWLTLNLVGTASNRDAVGTRITAVVDDLRQRRDVEAGSGLFSFHSLSVDFGIGSASIVDSLIIRWPSGVRQVFTDVAVNQSLVITEGTPPSTAVREERDNATPQSFMLLQNYPNPFNPETTISFDLPRSQEIELALYNLAGQKAATLAQGRRQAGTYTLLWDGRDDAGLDLSSGVYLYRLTAGDRVATRKLLLLR